MCGIYLYSAPLSSIRPMFSTEPSVAVAGSCAKIVDRERGADLTMTSRWNQLEGSITQYDIGVYADAQNVGIVR